MNVSDDVLLALALRGASGSGGGGTSDNIMVVNLTQNDSESAYVSDKTYGEVYDAVVGGATAVLRYHLKASSVYVLNWVMRVAQGTDTTIWYLNGNAESASDLLPHVGGNANSYVTISTTTPKD